MNVAELAAEMLAQSVPAGQSVRRVASDADAAALRQALRRLARAERIQIRTARIEDAVAIVRTDATIWHDDADTMRVKLTPSA